MTEHRSARVWAAMAAELLIDPQDVPTHKRHKGAPLTSAEAAARLGITIEQLSAFVHDGELRYVNVGRGTKRPRYRFTEADINEFIDNRKAAGEPMSVYKRKKSAPYFWFDFQIGGRRFHGSTRSTNRREAEKIEAQERERAAALVKAARHAAGSLQIDHVADRYWNERGQYHSGKDNTSRDLARLVEYFGKSKLLTDIADADVAKLVATKAGGDLGQQCHRQSLHNRHAAHAVRLCQVRGRPLRSRAAMAPPHAGQAGGTNTRAAR